MRQNDRRKRLFKTFTACLLAVAMLLSNVMGAVDVWAQSTVPTPKIDAVGANAQEVTGRGLVGFNRRKAANAVCKIHVTVKNDTGSEIETKEFSIEPTKRGSTWKVTLDNALQAGWTVSATQEFNGAFSDEATATVKQLLADSYKDKLIMPSGDFYLEQYVANILNDDEKAEALDLLKKANPTIAKDIKSVEFTITGVDPNKVASYTVTYDDNSVSEEIQAPGLTIKKVTETSRSPEIDSITIVDNVVKGKLAGPGPFDGIKVQLVLRVGDADKGTFCNEGKCIVDKNSSKPVAVTLNNDGTFSYILQAGESLKLDQIVGVSVKEPHKFVSCSTTTVKPVIPGKTEVKDPRKLTADDKKAIDAAIRSAYTVNGGSKLPNGTGDYDGVPAVIQIDASGNAKIFSGNDVAGDWDPNNNYKFVPEKNEDGSYKLKDGAQPKITIQAKDLVKNIKPEKPVVALSGDKKNITITPNLKVDTDASKVEVTYTGKDGKSKTVTATKGDSGWTIEGEGSVDANGVITLPKDKVKGETTVTATVTDKGGIAVDDKDQLTSDPGTLTVKETIADKVEALGGLDPVALKKWVGDTVEWKDGIKAKDSATDENKARIKEFLDEAKTTFADENFRGTTAEGDFTGKIKVTFDDGSFIEVDKQNLYVSNHVTSVERKDKLPTDALDVEFKLGEGTKVDNTSSGAIEGKKDNPTSYQRYKVKPGTDLKTYKLPTINTSVVDSIKLTAQDGYTEPVWRDSKNGTNFVATADNNVFTATATKTYKVTLDPNGGGGTKSEETKKLGEKYTLPKGDTFTPPENQEFAGWLVGDATTTTEPGKEITINSDTVIKASWKPIMVDVIFDKGEGSGEKAKATVAKGSEYTLPDSEGFTAPENKEFAGWEVNGKAQKVGDKITVTENTTVTAKWKPIMVDVSFDKGEGNGEKAKATVAKGSEYTLPDSEGFTAPENKEFDGWEVNGKAQKVGDKITVNESTTVIAKWKDIEYKVTFNGTEGKGTMEEKLVKKGNEYTLPDNGFEAPDNKVFDGWMVGTEKKSVGDTITVNGNTEVKAVWKPIMVDVSFDKGDGSGSKDTVSVAKGSEYTLPNGEGFTPPANQEFAGWEVDGVAKKVGDKITVNENTTVTAKYKPIMVDVIFEKGEGSGEKAKASVAKGSEYTLPDSEGFTPPANQEFAGWEVDGVAKKVGDKITVNENTTVTAKWKAIPVEIAFDKGDGSGTMAKATVDKGSMYKLPESKFTPPAGKVFAGWMINGAKEVTAAGTEIKIAGPIKLTAVYKDAPKSGRGSGFWFVPAPAEPEKEIGRHDRYLYGYEDKRVRPEGNITRAEAAALIARLAELDMSDKSKPDFVDTPSAWYNSAINIMVKKDLMFGDKNGNFRPAEPITRGEFARALLYIDATNDKVAPFADVKGHEFEAAINQAYGNNRISGYPDGTFRPDAPIQRAEAARILNQYANRGTTLEGMAPVAKDLIQFTDINPSHWAYCEVMEAANTHEYERVKGTQAETWLRILHDEMKR